jgi:putative N6-adenine-specific DNA methylase
LDFVAKTFQGLEPVLADELASLGASDIRPLKRAVAFSGDQELLYRANYELRTAISVLVSIHSFTCRNERQYYQSIYDFDWQQWLGLHDTFAIKAVVNSPHFNHSKFMALKAKDAIVDRFRDRTGRRPSINPRHPDVLIQIHIGGDQCTVSLDSSGEPLFKRNYRVKTGQAPLNEVLAAGMLKLAGWPQQAAFVDPMCGSGTLPIEAALIARNSAGPAASVQLWISTVARFQGRPLGKSKSGSRRQDHPSTQTRLWIRPGPGYRPNGTTECRNGRRSKRHPFREKEI